jgi:hypothetical protein
MKSKVLIGVLAALCASASTAPAITRKFSEEPDRTFRVIVPGQATWEISNERGTISGAPNGVCDPGAAPGLSVAEARLVANGVDRPDAFDGAFQLWVNDEPFVAPDAVEVTDRVLSAGPVALSGLQVTVEYRAMSSTPTLRALLTFENPTSAPIIVPFVLGTNFGSDGNTALRGEALPSENWHVTSDSDTDPGDPVVLMVSNGPDPFASSDVFAVGERFFTRAETFSCSTTDGRELGGTLSVPAGQTVRLLQFVRLAGTNAEGGNAGAIFDENPSLDDELMEGITPEQSLSIVNWSFFSSAKLTGGGASWFFSGLNGTSNGLPTGGECGAIPGIGLFDAGVSAPNFDAFDGGLLLFVDDLPLPLTNEVFFEDGTGVGVEAVTPSGLEVRLTYEALQSSPTLRTLVEVSNPTAAPVSTKVALATNFGSDDKTLIRSTSDGDAAITSADRWAITSDDGGGPNPDPVTTHIVAGPDAAVPPAISTDVFDCSGSNTGNGLLATYDLSIGPGETQTLLLFNQVHTLVDGATTDVVIFDENPAPRDAILEELDSTVLTSVVNWSLCRRTTYPDVLCRVGGLQLDTFRAAPAGPVGDKMLSRLGAASSAIEDAEALPLGRRGALKKLLKKAQASLKAFEKVLKSKKAKAVVPEAARVRLAATSAEIRATVKGLGVLQ